jgi:hypothetical protein
VAIGSAAAVKLLDSEFGELVGPLTATLARKRPSPLAHGRPATWAAGVLSVIARTNFLFDKTQVPHCTPEALAAACGVSYSAAAAKARIIEDLCLIDDLKFYDRALTREEIENTAGCGVPIVPRVLNLDASRFGGPVDIPNSHRLCVFLEAGDYEVTMVSPAQDPLARFTSWSDSGTGDWGTAYTAVGETSFIDGAGLPIGESSMQLAFDNTANKTLSFSLTAAERVYFAIEDGAVLDNQGGVSLLLVPEPGLGAMLVSGIALLGALTRRRHHRTTRHAWNGH